MSYDMSQHLTQQSPSGDVSKAAPEELRWRVEVKIWTFVIVTGLSTFFLQHGWCKDPEVSPFKDIAIPENIGTITKVRQEEPLNLFNPNDAWRHLKIHYRDESGGATNEILVVIVRAEDREARDTAFNDIARTAVTGRLKVYQGWALQSVPPG